MYLVGIRYYLYYLVVETLLLIVVGPATATADLLVAVLVFVAHLMDST